MFDPLDIRWSQGNIGEKFRDGTSIFDTYQRICDGMEKRNVPMMNVVHRRGDGQLVSLDNRRLAVYKMARSSLKCMRVKVLVVPMSAAEKELRRKSDSTVEGQSVRVRGTDKVIHADGSVTIAPRLTDGQLQHRADQGGHWSAEQIKIMREVPGSRTSQSDAREVPIAGTFTDQLESAVAEGFGSIGCIYVYIDQ